MSELAAQLNGYSGEVAVTGVSTLVLGPADVQEYSRRTIYILNTGGGSGSDITLVKLQSAPVSDDAALWVDIINPMLVGNLVAGAIGISVESNKSDKYIRVMAQTAPGLDTTVEIWLSVGAKL